MKNESITKTFAVATILCVVCAIIVSLSDVALKETQLRNKALDKQLNILSAAGLVEPGAKLSATEADKLFDNAETLVVDRRLTFPLLRPDGIRNFAAQTRRLAVIVEDDVRDRR